VVATEWLRFDSTDTQIFDFEKFFAPVLQHLASETGLLHAAAICFEDRYRYLIRDWDRIFAKIPNESLERGWRF